jgi:hypothetical protein
MDIIIEILLEVYLELMILILPEKAASRRFVILAKLFATLMLAGIFALVIWGCVLIFDYGNMLGIIPITVAAIISLFQITAGIILHVRHGE